MGGIFSLDSKLMVAMTKLANMLILNTLYVITCIPVFTVGAATTALYTVSFRMANDTDSHICKEYFRAFADNFKQGTVLWLILLAYGGISFFNIEFFYVQQNSLHYLYIPFIVILAVVVIISSYAFPLLSQFENKNTQILKNSLFMGIMYLPRSLAMGLINAIPFLVLLFQTYTFIQISFLWLFLYYAIAAAINVRLLRKVFAPYWKQGETEEEDETRQLES